MIILLAAAPTTSNFMIFEFRHQNLLGNKLVRWTGMYPFYLQVLVQDYHRTLGIATCVAVRLYINKNVFSSSQAAGNKTKISLGR
jgi:hypothetical protein